MNDRAETDDAPSWDWVRAQFELSSDYLHLGSSQFIASHPRPVREAIERHRKGLDANPVLYMQEHEDVAMQAVREAIVHYLGRDHADEIALTDSTTLGLALLYSGLPLQSGDEILTTDHEHFSQRDSLGALAERTGVALREITLYEGRAADADADAMVHRVLSSVSERTRLLALTWVHSDTGLKLPIAKFAAGLAEINRGRSIDTRVRLSVDGTHGFGIEMEGVNELRCDFFVADTHKWMYGPRGTGFIWAPLAEWQRVRRVVPSFTDMMDAYSHGLPPPPSLTGRYFTPGGFHSAEHRWATTEAFRFHAHIGRQRICERVHALNRQCKEGLVTMPHVILHTPMSEALSAGIVAFELRNMSTEDACKRLRECKIIATVAPYRSRLLRYTPGIYNSPEEVEAGLAAVADLADA